MSLSGIEVDPEVTSLYNDMKLKRTNKFITFRIENKKRVVVDQKGDAAPTETKEEDRQQFDQMKALLKDEPRYILYDFSFKSKEGRIIQKLAFIFWCSDSSKIGDKMIYASTKDTIKKTFTGLGMEFQANDMGDMDYETFMTDVEKKS